MISDSTGQGKTLVQCDFDGTVTEKDVAYLLLEAFADGDYSQLVADYMAGRMTVGSFNSRAFAMIKQDKPTLLDFVRRTVKIRDGFHELLDYCRRWGLRFVIVSNGLDFYINTILADIGVRGIEVFAAKTEFAPDGLRPRYIGPDGVELDSDFKETHTRLFLSQGYRVVYIGDGLSDITAARQAYHIFACGQLLGLCKDIDLDCTPFNDLYDVVRGLEVLSR
jgi:2-hydroxy-3-keto-5-methylthiopentenyl-1-phosphate phosphatase